MKITAFIVGFTLALAFTVSVAIFPTKERSNRKEISISFAPMSEGKAEEPKSSKSIFVSKTTYLASESERSFDGVMNIDADVRKLQALILHPRSILSVRN